MENLELTLSMVKYAELHCHNYYSIKDGGMSQAQQIQRAKDLNYYAIAETNHGKMYGSYEFWKNCNATKDKHDNPLTPIKPIIGVEAYVTPSLEYLHDKTRKKRYYHMILLAKNYKGYQELCHSTRISERQTFKKKPCLTEENLKTFFSNGNIIALSACIGGYIQQLLINGKYEKAKEKVLLYKSIFNGDFYMELQNHGIEEEEKIIATQVKLAKECGVECVITNDCHFATKEDKKYHDILICMQFGITLDEYNNRAYTTEHYMKTKEELYQAFRCLIPDQEIFKALNNTSVIADKCNVEFDKSNHYPQYKGLKGRSADEVLKEISYEKLPKISGFNTFSVQKREKYQERLDFELNVIKKSGYSDYFLVVSDLLEAYSSKIKGYSGLGRGSGVGSLVAYSLGITKVDPIEEGLFFDRFLNLERVSPPDFDLDFDNLRPQIFDYTQKNYGEEKVCKIITFGKYGARSAIRAVGRVLNIPLYFVDKVAKTIKADPNATIKASLDNTNELYSVEFDSLYQNDSDAKELIDYSMHFEGVIDHTGIHAAACIIGDDELSNYVPMQWDEGTQMWVTQFYKDYNEELGLLKMDYLGLNNLSVIKETARLVNNKYNLNLSHEKIIELALANQQKVIKEIYAKANTSMVFQFESPGMKDTLLRFGPKTLADLILLNAVYRPGPIQYIDSIIKNKKNPAGIKYDAECLRPILEETYGYPVYQEQIMSIFRAICGYSLGQADIIRRAMAKKKMNLIENAKKDFIKGCLKLKISKKRAEEFFEELKDFARYSFNKSHAAAYTITSLEIAFLKLEYPQEYMTACLSYIPKIEAYPSVLEECKKMNLKVLLPDINISKELFTPEGEDSIRFGLAAIKGVGKSAIEIVKSQPYASYVDFLVACKDFNINKGKLESLAFSGAFDNLGVNRATAIKNISIVQNQKKTSGKITPNQIDFFSIGAISNEEVITLEKSREMKYQHKLDKEYEVLHAYISGHPLDQYRAFCDYFSEKNIYDLTEDDDETEFNIVARIKDSSIIYRKKDNAPMGKLVLEDLTANINAIAFTKEYRNYSDYFKKGEILKFKVKAQITSDMTDDGEPILRKQFFIKEVSNLEAVDTVFVKVDEEKDIDDITSKLKHKVGGTQILFYVKETKRLVRSTFFTTIDDEVKDMFKENIAI